MRGVSEVIAIILILMITISLAGLAYMFMSTTMSDVTSSAGSTVDTTTSSMITSFIIESISQGRVYVRNTGQGTLTGLSVYVNDVSVNYTSPSSIPPGSLGILNTTSIMLTGNTIKVTSQNGVSASRTASADWYGSVLQWKFDEGSGTVTYDSSSYGNNVNISGATWATGVSGWALNFNGVSNPANATPNLRFQTIHGPSTVEIWFKASALSGERRIFSDNCMEWGLYHSGSALYGRAYWDAGGTAIQTGQWYQAVVVHEHPTGLTNTIVKLYVNGAFAGQASGSVTQNGYTDAPYWIGGDGCTAGTYFNGIVDEITIWNRSLTAAEISNLYGKYA